MPASASFASPGVATGRAWWQRSAPRCAKRRRVRKLPESFPATAPPGSSPPRRFRLPPAAGRAMLPPRPPFLREPEPPMKPRDRAPFSAIVDRPPLTLPSGLRLIVWPIVNLEEWEIDRAMARQVLPAPTGVSLIPDLRNWSWHEYWMRVGVWRVIAAFDRFNIKATLSINAKVVESYPRVAAAARERQWEFMGHSFVQGPIHKLEDQRATIRQSLDLLQKFTGKRPVGWLGPGLTQTHETPELLAEAGVQYIGDWGYDH